MDTVCNGTCTLCQCQEYDNVKYDSTYRCLAVAPPVVKEDDGECRQTNIGVF